MSHGAVRWFGGAGCCNERPSTPRAAGGTDMPADGEPNPTVTVVGTARAAGITWPNVRFHMMPKTK